MDNYKICVYAICKNEEKFIDRWYNSVKNADYVVVMDTGSTDNSFQKLQEKPNIILQQKIINPWRFDVARNESLKLIPKDTDICICVDLDEILTAGWRESLTAAWSNNTTRGFYTYIWNFLPDGKPGVILQKEKVHTLKDYIWTHACHEILEKITDGPEIAVSIPNFVIEHHADNTKSRGSYLNLLAIDVQERPDDDRARHYYGRELMFYGRNEEAIEQFKIHLSLPKAIWEPERCASMRYIARCSSTLEEKERWLFRALGEASYLREPWYDMALVQYYKQDWDAVIFYAESGLKIKENHYFYTNDPVAWHEGFYDLLSIAYYYKENYEKAYENICLACEENNTDLRLKENKLKLEKFQNVHL